MKAFLSQIIPKIKKYSRELDDVALLTNKHWVFIDESRTSKIVYVFRSNNELIISNNGSVEKGKWEYLGNNSLLIDKKEGSFLFKHGFFDSDILALKIDGKEEYAVLVNENRFEGEINSIEAVYNLLNSEYLSYTRAEKVLLVGGYRGNNLERDLNLFRNEVGKVGFLNKNGKTAIEFIYDGGEDFSEGLALVYKRGEKRDYYGFVNQSGQEVIPLIYEFAESFSEGLAIVREKRKFGYIKNNGELVIPFQFDDASKFKNGVAKVEVKEKVYMINKEGKAI
jgi:hypothetical protein